MARRLILWNNDANPIQGGNEADGYQDLFELDHISFAATATRVADGAAGGSAPAALTPTGKAGAVKADVEQSAITISLPFGPWVADLQQRLFEGKTLGTVTITEVEEEEFAGKKTWKKIREITLSEAWMESMSHSWNGIHATVSFSVQYQDMTFGHGDKISHYNRSEK